MATGMSVEINSMVVEDVESLRKKKDDNHMNVAKFDAIIKGVNLALKWGTERN